MIAVRIGRPTFLRETAVCLAVGAALGAVLLGLLLAVDRRDWLEPFGDGVQSLGIFYLVGLAFRLLLHVVHEYVEGRFEPEHREPRQDLLKYSRPPLALGAAGFAAGTVLLLGA